jgi:phosphoribosylaminoimidazolecarboxamide formyltransferase/IMP cyclohydrolase
MLRSAAKNHAAVTVVTSPESYDDILVEMRTHAGATTLATRKRLAHQVFELTSAYDAAIATWLAGALASEGICSADGAFEGGAAVDGAFEGSSPFRAERRLVLTKVRDLRYGENPHQRAALYRLGDEGAGAANGAAIAASDVNSEAGAASDEGTGVSGAASRAASSPASLPLACAEQLQGKELSYNNYLDLDAAWAAVREYVWPTAVIVKHLTPCGIASHDDIAVAWRRAFDCDPISAFGGVMAFNARVTAALIEAVYAEGQFVEALVAPAFDAAALELLAQKPSVRVLVTGGLGATAAAPVATPAAISVAAPAATAGERFDYRSIEGGILCMDTDLARNDERALTFESVSARQPTAEELDGLRFAWLACKSVKSNAIVIAKGRATIGIGAGQPNRVNSARLAVQQAGEAARGAVAASDAFMPFADSLEVLAEAGVTAVIQPGGSVRDAEVLAAANAAGMAVVFTGRRHFRH